MGYTRGISVEEERARTKRDIEHITRPKKPWDEHKFDGRYICAVCGDFIRTKKGDIAERHEKKTVQLGRDRKDTFWTHRHKRCGPEEEEPKKQITDTELSGARVKRLYDLELAANGEHHSDCECEQCKRLI